ncbi:DUF4214 domain-containing protein [Marinobacter sp.]|uniref:DUF4214 domain-containing protein n=1 Tax=Marinobacter sp. TaxID=50741 RepID=UPI003A91C672
MAVADQFATVQKLYIAFYQRPADSAGRQYWAEQVESQGLQSVINAFATSPEATALYGEINATTIGSVIDKIYQAAFGHAADAAGKAYYVEQFNAGNFTPATIALNVVNGAQNADATVLSTKAQAADLFTAAAANVSYDEADITAARDFLAGVSTTVPTQASVEAVVAEKIAPVAGSALTLTAGADAITGTANADTITGVVSALTSARTLDVADKIDGGAGPDTLNVDLQSNFAGFTANVGGLSNVETVNLTNAGTISRTFDATGVAGVEQYNLKGNISLADLADTKAAVSISNIADNAAVSLGYVADATKGTTDTLNVALNALGAAEVKNAAGTVTTAQKTVAVTANGIETLALNTAGDNFVSLTGDKAAAITVAGAGSLTTGVTTATKTFDASANAGAVKVDLANAAAGAVTSVATGAGADVITANVGDLAVNAAISGGEGTDRLELTSGAAATTQYQLSGVETISLGALTGGLTFSAAKASGVETIEATANLATAATFAGMGAGDLAFNLLGAGTGGLISADQTGASTVNVTAAATATAAAPSVNDIDVTASNSTSLKLNVGANASYSGTVTAGKATSVEVAGTVNAATIAAGVATSAVLNTTGASTLALNAARLTDLNATVAAGTAANAGSLNLTSSAALASLESLTANIGANSTFTVGDLAKANSVSLSGAGAAVVGKLGGTGQEYGVTVNAEGLKALTVDNITTAAAQNVSVNASTVLGAVNLGDVTVGAGASTGSIAINANGTTGAVTLGDLSAKDVSIDAAGALSTVSYGTITVGNSLVLNGSDLSGNAANINATGASLNATLNGGIGTDAFTITGAAATLSYKVVGDLDITSGGASDSVTVTAAAQTDATKSVTIDVSGLTGAETTTLTGGAGKDTIIGGAAADAINGGALADKMTGGAGADTFGINTDGAATAAVADVVTDFSLTAGDKLSFGGAAGSDMTYREGNAGVTDFAAALVAANAQLDGEVVYSAQQVGSDTYVFFGTTASTATDVVQLVGVSLADIGATALVG